MTELTKYKDYPIWGYFVVMCRDGGNAGVPVFVSLDGANMLDWLAEVRDIRVASDYRIAFVSGEDFGNYDITAEIAADLAERWAEHHGIDADTSWTDFPGFAAAHAEDVIDEILNGAREASKASSDERAAFYSHANRGTKA